MAATLEQIPYTLEMGIVIDHASSEEVQMTLPDAAGNQNMVGLPRGSTFSTEPSPSLAAGRFVTCGPPAVRSRGARALPRATRNGSHSNSTATAARNCVSP